MVAEDGWRNAIHGCKEDEKNKRLDEDVRRDSKEKEGVFQVEERQFLDGKKALAK